jgi:hypothetical protein
VGSPGFCLFLLGLVMNHGSMCTPIILQPSALWSA